MLSTLWESLMCGIGGITPSWEREQQAWIDEIRKYPNVWSLLVARRTDSHEPRKILCVPASQSLYLWGDDAFSEEAAREHILQPVASEKHYDTGEFVTLSGTAVHLSGSAELVFTYVPHSNSRSVRILRTSSVLLQNSEVTLWHTDKPFIGGLPCGRHTRLLSAYNTVAMLRSTSRNEAIFSDVDRFVQDITLLHKTRLADGVHAFSLANPPLQLCVEAVYGTAVAALDSAEVQSGVDAFQVEEACEEYLMSGIGALVHAWILHERACTLQVEDAQFLHLLADIKATGWRRLDVIPGLQCAQPAAIVEIRQLPSAVTPMAKLAVMRRVVSRIEDTVNTSIKENGDSDIIEFATDDLIQVLSFVIAHAAPQYQTLAADVRYIKEYHFASSSAHALQDELFLCHFEAAELWLRGKLPTPGAMATTQMRSGGMN